MLSFVAAPACSNSCAQVYTTEGTALASRHCCHRLKNPRAHQACPLMG